MLSGILSLFTNYTKAMANTGHGNSLVRAAALQVLRFLVLILGDAFWAAAHLGCYIQMPKPHCRKYLYEVFVRNGKSMTSADFSKRLGRFTYNKLGRSLKLADFQQFMSCLMIHVIQTMFHEDEEDPDVVIAHEAFGHTPTVGRKHYGLGATTKAMNLLLDSIRNMHQVCLKWQAYVKLPHPSISKNGQLDAEVFNFVLF